METTQQTVTSPKTHERRRSPDLRQHFAIAQALIAPMLADPENHNGAAFYRAMHKLQATFPNMSGNEIEALVAAVVRSMQTRARRTAR